MGVAKYSPTVTASYRLNQDWWRNNGGDSDSIYGPEYDYDGYDAYGYDKNNCDRAGYTEWEYGVDYDEHYGYRLYDRIAREWEDKFAAGISYDETL